MADVTLARQTPGSAGAAATRNAIATGNTYKVRNDGATFLLFEKTGAGAATITITTPITVGGLAVTDRTINVPATTGDVLAGPFAPGVYNDGSGDLNFTTDEGTGLTCAVLGG